MSSGFYWNLYRFTDALLVSARSQLILGGSMLGYSRSLLDFNSSLVV